MLNQTLLVDSLQRVMAKKLNRNSIGIELNKTLFPLSKKD